MASAHAPGPGARIMTLSFDPALLSGRHARCHTGAEYLAEIASSAGPDTAMAAREISACIFELFEFIRQRPQTGAVRLTLSAVAGGVDVRALIPGDGSDGDALAPTDHDPIVDPRPGDGLRELVAIHGVALRTTAASQGALIELHVPLHPHTAHDDARDDAGGAPDGR